jgi:hypothetical protein
LDDAGVLFYVKSTKIRKPEDVESIAQWFSSALKGFLGVSAIANYIEFIWRSPIFNSPNIMSNKETVDEVLFFIFGFLVVIAFSFAILTVIIHEIVMPYSANRLYKRLGARNIEFNYKSIDFKTIGTLDPEVVIEKFLDIPVKIKKGKDRSKSESNEAENPNSEE